MIINGVEFDNTFLVVRRLNLEVILGNDFLKRHRVIIDFNRWVVELDHEFKQVRVSFEWVLGEVKIAAIKIIQKQFDGGDTEMRVNICRESEERERNESEE